MKVFAPLKLLYLPHRDPTSACTYWDELVAAIDKCHELVKFDHSKPIKPQFVGVDVVLDFGGSVGTPTMMDEATSVKLWQILGTGFERFPLKHCRAKGIPVANCPGVHSAIALAESAMMFMLMLARSFGQSQNRLRRGVLFEPMGQELQNRRLGLIGFGASARQLARLARAFGMQIAAIDRVPINESVQAEHGLEFVGLPDQLEAVLKTSDFVSLHLHLNSETHHLIDAKRLRCMQPSAYLINIARGALVDEQALYAALATGRLAGAALDVFREEPVDPDHPLLRLENVICTPHISGVTDGTLRRRAAFAAENVDRIAKGLEPRDRIDTLKPNTAIEATS